MKKLSDILLIAGGCLLIGGIIAGVIIGRITAEQGLNLVVAVPIWLLSIVAGGGCISVSGSISEAEGNKANDLELLNQIIEKMQSENK